MVERAAADIHLVVFVCEAGMGSSLIGANTLKRRVKDAGFPVKVIHARVNEIPPETDVVIAHEGLSARARRSAPQAVVLSFKNFLNNTASDQLIQSLSAGTPVSSDNGAG
jgi:mannitol PTS system EIICBA or EIICB component